MEGFGQAEFEAAVDVSRETSERLATYVRLLEEWRSRINLVSASTMPDIWHRHIYDSAQIFALLPPPAAPLVDIGSGAGFPGLVLAMMGVPEVHLIEADGRKCAFLSEVIQATEINVRVHNERAEQMKPIAAQAVTARALAPLGKLLGYVAPFLGKNGTALLSKGKSWQEELTEARRTWKMTVDSIPSLSSDSGVILRIKDLRRGTNTSS
jgi:16S rRNA (guanine527-N7)-methyltransferase